MLLAASGAGIAAERTVTLQVDNMTCSSCPYIITKTLERVNGVIAVDISFEDRRAVVKFHDDATSVDELTATTAEVGFPSRAVNP